MGNSVPLVSTQIPVSSRRSLLQNFQKKFWRQKTLPYSKTVFRRTRIRTDPHGSRQGPSDKKNLKHFSRLRKGLEWVTMLPKVVVGKGSQPYGCQSWQLSD